VNIGSVVAPNGTGNVTVGATATSVPTDTNPNNNNGAHTFAATDFSVTAAPTSISISAGQTATYQLTLGPTLGSYGSPVSFACTGAPAHAQCKVSPASVQVNGSNVVATVTVSTSARSNNAFLRRDILLRSAFVPLASLFVLSFAFPTKRRQLTLVAISLFAFSVLPSCGGGAGGNGNGTGNGGGGSSSGTPAGTYSLTIQASSGTDTKTASVSLTVN